MRCRTESAGAIAYRCMQCARVHMVPKSCGNRHCPTCQGAKAKDWLAAQQACLLPCAYFMMTFTVPSEFRAFMRSHPRECYKALFEAVYQSLITLAQDPKHYRPMTVPDEEFIRRFLQHVLPKGFQKVRHFGFMHKRSKISRVWLAMLVTVTLNMVYVLIVNPPGPPAKQPMRCPDCGGDLECLGFARSTYTQNSFTSPKVTDTS